MRNEYIYLGTMPLDEPCLQAGEDEPSNMRIEAAIYKDQLERMFKPKYCFLKIEKNFHEFGIYYTVIAVYHANNEKAVNEAFNIESNEPMKWDEISKPRIEALYASINTIK